MRLLPPSYQLGAQLYELGRENGLSGTSRTCLDLLPRQVDNRYPTLRLSGQDGTSRSCGLSVPNGALYWLSYALFVWTRGLDLRQPPPGCNRVPSYSGTA